MNSFAHYAVLSKNTYVVYYNIQWRATQREYMAADFGCKEVYP